MNTIAEFFSRLGNPCTDEQLEKTIADLREQRRRFMLERASKTAAKAEKRERKAAAKAAEREAKAAAKAAKAAERDARKRDPRQLDLVEAIAATEATNPTVTS
jgi:hypothetical protein